MHDAMHIDTCKRVSLSIHMATFGVVVKWSIWVTSSLDRAPQVATAADGFITGT